MIKTIKTPAFVIDENILLQDIALLRKIADEASCKLLYSPKACSISSVLEIASGHVDGFGCSSLFEVTLVDQICGGDTQIHLVSPLLKEDTLRTIGDRLDYVTMNSLSQWGRLRDKIPSATQPGIRVNPQLSFINDRRYDPCRPNSKLGVPIDKLAEMVSRDDELLQGIKGIHFHTNCDATEFASLLATARHIQGRIPKFLERLTWVNMGGGYIFNEVEDYSDFFQAVEIFRETFGLEVFIEPGASVVRRAATIEATVHDLFESGGAKVAILDATVNHMSEVFEFQFEPDVLGYSKGGSHPYILAGCTCLAGDVFGEYAFDTPLDIGSKVKFPNMGAYTISKAHRFNGVALLSIYMRRSDGAVHLLKEDTFDDFAGTSGVICSAAV